MRSIVTAILLGASPVAAFGMAGRLRVKASARAPAPQLVLRRVRNFVSSRLTSPFSRDNDAEADVLAGESLVTDSKKLKVPAPVADLDKKSLSAVDSVLVRLGVKTEDECVPVRTKTMCRPCEDHVYNHTRCVLPEEGEDLMEQIKCAGRAGIISYILWEWQPVQKHPCPLTPVRQLRGSSRSSTPNGSAGAYEPQLSRPGGHPVAPRAAFPAFNQ